MFFWQGSACKQKETWAMRANGFLFFLFCNHPYWFCCFYCQKCQSVSFPAVASLSIHFYKVIMMQSSGVCIWDLIACTVASQLLFDNMRSTADIWGGCVSVIKKILPNAGKKNPTKNHTHIFHIAVAAPQLSSVLTCLGSPSNCCHSSVHVYVYTLCSIYTVYAVS